MNKDSRQNRLRSQSTFFLCCRQVNRVGWLAVGMFAGVILDTWTTYFFVSRNCGFELNPILAPLIRYSLIWIPIYFLCRPLVVLLLPEFCRSGFSVYFGFNGLLGGINNLSGILYGNYFLTDTFGFLTLQVTSAVIAIAVFVWVLWKHASTAQERKYHIIMGLYWTGIFVLMEAGFFAIGRIALA